MRVLRTDEGLPCASGARVARQVVVRLETELPSKRRLSLAQVAGRTGEASTTQLDFNEELGVERRWRGVERNALKSGVDVVSSRYRVPMKPWS